MRESVEREKVSGVDNRRRSASTTRKVGFYIDYLKHITSVYDLCHRKRRKKRKYFLRRPFEC